MKTTADLAETTIEHVGRRRFLKGAGAFVVSFSLPLTAGSAQAFGVSPDIPLNAVDSWLKIDSNGKVTLLCGKVELGTGIKTAFAQLVAEELDVPLFNVTVIHGDTGQTPDQGVTSISRSISHGGPPVRAAAAEARMGLLELASRRLGVPVSELKVSDGVVSHGLSRVSYGQLVGSQQFNREISGKAALKKPGEFKVIGTSAQRLEIPGKVTGKFTYVQDVRVPKMLHARVIRPAVVGASLVRVGGFPKPRPNVRIVRKVDFLAVAAPTEWEAIQAARELKVEWSGGGLPKMATFHESMRTMPSHDVVTVKAGDIDAGFKSAAKTLSATYSWPFHSHGSIGPSCAVADIKKDGTATVWSATQDVYMQREALARLLGLQKEKVRVIFVEGSGCYGHNGADDANGDAALISQELGVPVRVQYTRADELGWAPRGAPYLVDVKAGLNDSGDITAWDYQAWVMSHSSRYRYYGKKVSGYLLPTLLSGGEVDVEIVSEPGRILGSAGFSATRTAYQYPNARTLIHGLQPEKPHPLRASELRSVAGLGALFASEGFMDELAAAAGKDPIQFRLAQLNDQRAIDVIKAVAQLSKWEERTSPKPRERGEKIQTGRGVAFYSGATYVAVVADVAVNMETGVVTVSRMCVAHDCGLIVNPDGLNNQIEGNAIQATSRVLNEEVKWDDSRVTSVDWVSYPILRFPDVPEVQTTLINRPEVASTGAGEPTSYPIAGAIGNAVFDATGARMRRGPFTPENVKEALKERA